MPPPRPFTQHIESHSGFLTEVLGKEPDQIKQSDVDKTISPYGYKGDGKELPAGATSKTLGEMLGPLTDKLKDIDGLKLGTGLTPTSVTFSPAMLAAKKMQKKIQDQLEESNASKHLQDPLVLFYWISKDVSFEVF